MTSEAAHAGGHRPLHDSWSRSFPVVPAAAPEQRREALKAVRLWAEHITGHAIERCAWGRRSGHMGSRDIRGLSVLLAVEGTAAPSSASTSAAGR
ncbi:hypothetical protein ABT116_20105 [Streptomyces sp. NPDC002130]|uniref:hypothetical protein n=1 Tax=Streptomyces sp. NPDC002130 TaxID=3155568 RepID=UPI003325D06A